tara:strand:+ start:2020 stop:2961 length:942 start_codon:yes stop_codon:yes gene_type:complete
MKCLLVGGSGQFGICLSKILLKKKFDIDVTSRSVDKTKKKFQKLGLKKIKIIQLNILNKKKIKKILKKRYDYIFYFAGQSSPSLSFKKKIQTFESNYLGCKNFLETFKELNLKTKFFNSSSSEIFSDTNKRITINSKKKPISPYGRSKLLSFNLTKKFRKIYNINAFNLILFNSESFYRDKNYLISKICLAAIYAKNFKKITGFGKLDIIREWNWCEDQCGLILKCLSKKPDDFILSNGKEYSGYQMLSFAFDYFNLNYKEFIKTERQFYRKRDFRLKKSDFKRNIKKIDPNWKPKVFGKKLIHKLIRYYHKN